MKKLLPKTTKNPQGFTLIELMVVITILAILSVAGLTVFGSTQRSARDSRRKTDVEAVSKALESRYDGNASAGSRYPALTTDMFSDKKIPLDPNNAGAYIYTSASLPNSTYYFCARMENNSGGNYSDSTAGVTGSTYFCRTAQQ